MIFLKVFSDQILSTPGWPIIDHPALTRAECATEFHRRPRPQPSHQNTFQSQINRDFKNVWYSFNLICRKCIFSAKNMRALVGIHIKECIWRAFLRLPATKFKMLLFGGISCFAGSETWSWRYFKLLIFLKWKGTIKAQKLAILVRTVPSYSHHCLQGMLTLARSGQVPTRDETLL